MFRPMFIVLLMLSACSARPIQTSVHVTTYRDGQTDIVRRDLLFRGPLKPNTVRDTLREHGLSEATTITTRGTDGQP